MSLILDNIWVLSRYYSNFSSRLPVFLFFHNHFDSAKSSYIFFAVSTFKWYSPFFDVIFSQLLSFRSSFVRLLFSHHWMIMRVQWRFFANLCVTLYSVVSQSILFIIGLYFLAIHLQYLSYSLNDTFWIWLINNSFQFFI